MQVYQYRARAQTNQENIVEVGEGVMTYTKDI